MVAPLTASDTTLGSLMGPQKYRMPGWGFAPFPALRLKTRTEIPFSRRRRTRWLPRNPPPPITRTSFTGRPPLHDEPFGRPGQMRRRQLARVHDRRAFSLAHGEFDAFAQSVIEGSDTAVH